MIIFMHGVIPHNHQGEEKGSCESVFHNCHDTNQTIDGNEIRSNDLQTAGAHSICHFSTGPYNHSDTDFQFYTQAEAPISKAPDHITELSVYSSDKLFQQFRHTPGNRRGPPASRG